MSGTAIARTVLPTHIRSGLTYRFWYTNWEGKRGYYTGQMIHFWSGSTTWHPDHQLLVNMYTKKGYRDFACNSIEWDTFERAPDL